MSWADGISATGTIATPIVVAALGIVFATRANRSQSLLAARIEYYKALTPELNILMCYMTFIGRWRDYSPPDIVDLKRRLDHSFFCAAPLFSDPVRDSYDKFMALCFQTFNLWGQDALIRSSPYRREQSWRGPQPWDAAWDRMFSKDPGDAVPATELTKIRRAHDDLLAAIVRDLDPTRARSRYTTDLVSLNAHAPKHTDIEGSNG